LSASFICGPSGYLSETACLIAAAGDANGKHLRLCEVANGPLATIVRSEFGKRSPEANGLGAGALIPLAPRGLAVPMFATPAFAQTASSPMEPLGGLLIPMLLMLGIFYFFLIRPQSQRAKELRERVNAVRRGDTVITSGGMVGKVLKASDTSDEIEVELAENLRVRVVKSTLLEVRSKGEPVKEAT
jgi:preprotein translocase subunit YajC